MPIKKELQSIDKFKLSVVYGRRDALNKLLVEDDDIARAVGEKVEFVIPAMLAPYANRLGVAVEVLEQSLYSLLGSTADGHVTYALCRKANWILAANVDQMRQGHPVAPFTTIYRGEWTPMAIVEAFSDFNWVQGTTYVFKSLAGYTATEEFKKFIPGVGGMFVHKDMLGLPKRKYYYFNPSEQLQYIDKPAAYVGMITWALIEPGCEFGAPFDRAEHTTSSQSHNRRLFIERYTKPCPAGYTCACTACHIGYETCYRSVHKYNYVLKHCAGCHDMATFAEHDANGTMCLKCTNDALVKRKLKKT